MRRCKNSLHRHGFIGLAALALAVAAALPASTAPPSGAGAQSSPKLALLCLERPEQNGRLNIVPTIVRVVGLQEGPNGNQEVTLIGGQNVCFRVEGHRGEIQVRFTRSPLGPSDRKTYWTASFPVVMKRHENIYVLDAADIQPIDEKNWETTGWHHQWKIEPVSVYCRSDSQWGACPDFAGH
jgi:hypothetical protein